MASNESRKMTKPALAGWIALALVALAVYPPVFDRAFPFWPEQWQVSRAEAEIVALEGLRTLGSLPDQPYLLSVLETDTLLETHLQEALKLQEGDHLRLRRSRLASGLMSWDIKVYARGASSGDWSYRARVAPSGDVLALEHRVPEGEEVGDITPGQAVEAAGRFLASRGVDLTAYDEPKVLEEQLGDRSNLTLVFRDREAVLGEAFDYGVEVSFAGDRLQGYEPYFEDSERGNVNKGFRLIVLLNQLWAFLPIPLLLIVAVPFIRKYHEGEIGVHRGLLIGGVVMGCGLVVVLFCARVIGAGFRIGVLSQPLVTLAVGAQFFLLFFLPMTVMAMLSWSVGEWYNRESGGARLAALSAFFDGDWLNATFARASLRGAVSGLAVTAALTALTAVLRENGVWTFQGYVLGPWWENARWFAVPLLAYSVAYALYSGLLGRLLMVSVFRRFLGQGTAVVLAVVMGAFLFFPVTSFASDQLWNVVMWLVASAAWVFLFVRYGIYTSIFAFLVQFVFSSAMPLLRSDTGSLSAQASLALFVVSLPVVVSLRHILSSTELAYSFQDVPAHVRRIAQRERQKVELETARRIQTSILPDLPPQIHGVTLCHAYLPATEVGGDFYDVLALEDGRLALAVGDVAGHGVSSGLVMAMTKSALAVQVTFDPTVDAVFGTLNRMVFQSARKRLLATLCYAVLDPRTGQLSFASAGHLFPYRVSRRGEVEALESVSYPLGVRSELAIHQREATLVSGDQLVLFSDGVVEARASDSDELYGFERFEQSLSRHAGASVEALRDHVLEDLTRFTLKAPREDDLTLLILGIP